MSESKDGRAERLKAALRDNLRRRKAQEKARAPGEAATGALSAEGDAGLATESASRQGLEAVPCRDAIGNGSDVVGQAREAGGEAGVEAAPDDQAGAPDLDTSRL